MAHYLIPTSDEFIESIAKSIARNRLFRESEKTLSDMPGGMNLPPEIVEGAVDKIFEALWAGELPSDERQRDGYREDAKSAVRAINLKLMTSLE